MIKSVAFCTICLLSWRSAFVWAAAAPAIHLDFPAGTAGRCPGCADCTQNPPPAVAARGLAAGLAQLFEHFTLQDSTGANADIYFPIDGHQPTTPDAAVWSCANVDANNPASPITLWYMDAFFTHNFGFTRLNGASPIIQIQDPRELPNFRDIFRIIAANPVGRVLLYRLLIEIRREDAGMGCCGDGLIPNKSFLASRDASRRINIKYEKEKFAFNPEKECAVIKCDLDAQEELSCLRINNGVQTIDTFELLAPIDIDLFHEMLHWFQFLRHPVRELKESKENCKRGNEYMYLSRCYYGNISERFTWGGKINHREMRVILGAPNYGIHGELSLFHQNALWSTDPGGFLNIVNGGVTVGYLPPECVFYNGDDLSENAYRMARHTAANPVRMRFGHGGVIGPIDITNPGNPGNVLIPNEFRLAHLVAITCCNAIVTANGGVPINNWRLVSGEAAE
jgi:hypothetical protein